MIPEGGAFFTLSGLLFAPTYLILAWVLRLLRPADVAFLHGGRNPTA